MNSVTYGAFGPQQMYHQASSPAARRARTLSGVQCGVSARLQDRGSHLAIDVAAIALDGLEDGAWNNGQPFRFDLPGLQARQFDDVGDERE